MPVMLLLNNQILTNHQSPLVISELGDQGDGITRVERGFVEIVPETEVGDFECFVDFGGVDGGDTLAVNALVFEFVEDNPVVFERSITSTGPLDRPVLAVDGLVVVEAI